MADNQLLNGKVIITNGHCEHGPVIVGDFKKCNNNCDNKDTLKEPPDGGLRAWIVALCAFLCNGVLFGIINTYSVIYSHLKTGLDSKFDAESSTKPALVGSLTIGTTFLLSPISGILTDKIGLRCTTFIGGLLTAGGMFLSSFYIDDIEMLCLTYGIMYGIGAALAYTPTLSILGHYFKRYLGTVSGFVTAGSSVFTVVMPTAVNYLLNNYGLDVTLRVFAIMCCIVIMCGFVYKPLRTIPKPITPTSCKTFGRSKCTSFMRSIINVDIWKRKRYVIWALSVPLALFGYFVIYVHMVEFVRREYPQNNENLPIIFIGISSGIGRLLFGVLADLPFINNIVLQQISLACIGLLTMFLPAANNYILFLVIIFIMGLFDGCFISLLGPISYEMCGSRGATQAIGFLLGLSSLPLTIGPPLAGKIFESYQSYTIPFVLAGIPPIVGAALITLTRCVRNDSIEEETIVRNGEAIVPLTRSHFDPEALHGEVMSNGHITSNGDVMENGKSSSALATEFQST